MSWKIDKDSCIGCGTCVSICPKEAITIQDDLATINKDLCVECGACSNNCPVDAIIEIE